MRLAMVLHAEGDLRGADPIYREALPVLQERGAATPSRKRCSNLASSGRRRATRRRPEVPRGKAQAIRTSLRAGFRDGQEPGGAGQRLAIEERHPEAAEPLLGPALEVFAAQKAARLEASAQAVLARSLLGGKGPTTRARRWSGALALSQRAAVLTCDSPCAGRRVMATNGKVEEACSGLTRPSRRP